MRRQWCPKPPATLQPRLGFGWPSMRLSMRAERILKASSVLRRRAREWEIRSDLVSEFCCERNHVQELTLTRLNLHPHPVFRAQRDQRLRLNPVPWDQPQLPSLRQRGQNKHAFHPRKRFSNALPHARAKRKISKFCSTSLAFRRKSIGIETQRIGKIPGVAVCDELADQHRGSPGQKEIAQSKIVAG